MKAPRAKGLSRDPYRDPLPGAQVQRTVEPPRLIEIHPMDRETARRNMTAGLIAGGFVATVFALCFIVALLYIAHG